MTKIHFSSLHPLVTVVMVCEREALTEANLKVLLDSSYLARIHMLCLPLQEYAIRDCAGRLLADSACESSFESIPNADQWYKAAHCFLAEMQGSVEARHLVFFVGASVELSAGCLDRLVDTFLATPNLSGVNPLFLRREEDAETVAYLGLAVDSQKQLHCLYEGVERQHPVVKNRSFQLAHPGALLVFFQDFLRCEGFITPLEGTLCAHDFCRRLRQLRGPFLVETEALAWQHDIFDSWHLCGLWNSYVGNGRLQVDIACDYPGFVHEDGLSYGASSWLEEGPVEIWNMVRAGYLEHQRTAFPCVHDPLLLGHWLVSLSNPLLWEMAVTLSGNLPYFYPHAYADYEACARRLLDFARTNGETVLEQSVLAWQKSKRRFHYGMLHKTMEVYQSSQFFSMGMHLIPSSYAAWLELEEPELLRNDIPENFGRLEQGSSFPTLALAFPVYKARPDYLASALDSVRCQTYPHWQLCMVDDASDDPDLAAYLAAQSRDDARIRFTQRTVNGGISRASNTALKLCDAPYLGFLDQDDLLAPSALAEFAHCLVEKPQLHFLYSDEDVITDEGQRRSPTFRTPFSAFDFVPGHLMFYATELLHSLRGLRPAMDGAQDYDLALRAGERLSASEICHIPRILYHWRLHANSSSMQLAAKPYVTEATKETLESCYQRAGISAKACATARNNFFVMRLLGDIPNTSVVVCFGPEMRLDDDLARQLLELQEQDDCEIIFLLAQDYQEDGAALARRLGIAVTIETDAISCASNASGDMLLFLHAELSPLSECRPRQLIKYACLNGIGMVGGILWREGVLWHCGFSPDGQGGAFPLYQGLPKSLQSTLESGLLLGTRRVVAPSRLCFAIRRELFCSFTGFDPAFGALAEVDLGLRLEQAGYRSLVSAWGQWAIPPRAQLPPQDMADQKTLRQKHEKELCEHPLRNPNLVRCALGHDWQLKFTAIAEEDV